LLLYGKNFSTYWTFGAFQRKNSIEKDRQL
jgi:hypothetical protein